MTINIKNDNLRKRLARCARIVDRSERFIRLSFLTQEEAQLILREHEAEEEFARISEPEPKQTKKKASPWASEDDVMADTLRTDEEDGTLPLSEDDGSYPVGPRAEKNKSRYQINPGHGEGLSDVLRSTASAKASLDIKKLLNG